MQKRWLANLIEEKKKEFGVSQSISESTVRSRITRKNLDPKHPGVVSPMEKVEHTIVALAIQMGKICQPSALEYEGDNPSGQRPN